MLRRSASVWTVGSLFLAPWLAPKASRPEAPQLLVPAVWAAPGQAPACAPVPAGMVSWWRGEGDASDFSRTNPGTIQGNVTFAAGMVGQAFSLNNTGTSVGAVVVVPDHATLDLANEFTVEFWFNYTNVGMGRGMVSKRSGTGVINYAAQLHRFWGLGLLYNDPSVSSGDDFTIGRGAFESVRLRPAPAAGTFHHFAGTYRQTPSGIELQMFVDGQLVRSAVVAGSLASTLNDAPLVIGASAANGEPFYGLLDEVTIYNRALTAEEVLAIHQAGGVGKCVVMLTPFARFEIDRARVELDRGATGDRVEVWGRFALGASSDGIAPLTEDVEITIGSVTHTIPSGWFVRTDEDDGWQFHSNLPGLRQVVIRDNGVFRVRATDMTLGDEVSRETPLSFALRIGNDEGRTDINSAERLRMR